MLFRQKGKILLTLCLAGFAFAFFPPDLEAIVDINSIQLEATLNPVVNGVYSVDLRLQSPTTVKVGDEISVGPRDVSKIQSLGVGFLESQKLAEVCTGFLVENQNRATYNCLNSGFVPIEETELVPGQLVTKQFSVTERAQFGANSGDLAVPAVKLESGEVRYWLGLPKATGQLEGGQQQVLPTIFGYGIPDFVKNVIGTGVISTVNNVMSAIFGLFNEVLNAVFAYFIGPGIEALLAIRTYKDEFAAPIFPAWKIMRNLSNIVFIVSIIGIGLGTIFGLDSWSFKGRQIRNLVYGAIGINFSLVIAQTILGVADTIQNTFLPADTGALRLIGEELMVRGKGLAFKNFGWGESFGTFDTTVKLIFGFMVSFGAFVAFCALWFFLLIRTIALWLLLMTSPLAYAAMALPMTRSFTTRWWNNFIKYAFMTAAVGFMINLTALIAQNQKDVIYTLTVNRTGVLNNAVSSVMYGVISQAVIIAFLFASIKVAAYIGAESGGWVNKVSDKGWRSAVGGTKAGLRTARNIGTLGTYESAKTHLKFKADDYKKQYLDKVGSKFGPEDKDGNKRGWASRTAFNFLTGGKYFEAKLKQGENMVATAQSSISNRAKDWRNLVTGKTLSASNYEESKRISTAVNEHADAIELQDGAITVDDAVALSQNGLKAEGAYTSFLAKLQKILDDRNLDNYMSKIGVTNIEDFYGYLAKQGLDDKRLGSVLQTVNGKQLQNGYLQHVVNYDAPMRASGLAKAYDEFRAGRATGVGAEYTYDNAAGATVSFGDENAHYRDRRWGAKNEIEQAKDFPPETLFTLDRTVRPPRVTQVSEYAADWVANFAKINSNDPAAMGQARAMAGALSTDKRKYYKQVLSNQNLWQQVGNHLLAVGVNQGQINNAYAVLDQIV